MVRGDIYDPRLYIAACHEIAHYLYLNKTRCNISPLDQFKLELQVWRLAKSFMKPAAWDEKYAIDCLLAYCPEDLAEKFNYQLADKLQIIPINRGIRL